MMCCSRCHYQMNRRNYVYKKQNVIYPCCSNCYVILTLSDPSYKSPKTLEQRAEDSWIAPKRGTTVAKVFVNFKLL